MWLLWWRYQCDGQYWNQCKLPGLPHSFIILFKQTWFFVAPSGGQICNQLKRFHWNQFQAILVERFTQVMNSTPWVRCASNKNPKSQLLIHYIIDKQTSSKSWRMRYFNKCWPSSDFYLFLLISTGFLVPNDLSSDFYWLSTDFR